MHMCMLYKHVVAYTITESWVWSGYNLRYVQLMKTKGTQQFLAECVSKRNGTQNN